MFRSFFNANQCKSARSNEIPQVIRYSRTLNLDNLSFSSYLWHTLMRIWFETEIQKVLIPLSTNPIILFSSILLAITLIKWVWRSSSFLFSCPSSPIVATTVDLISAKAQQRFLISISCPTLNVSHNGCQFHMCLHLINLVNLVAFMFWLSCGFLIDSG